MLKTILPRIVCYSLLFFQGDKLFLKERHTKDSFDKDRLYMMEALKEAQIAYEKGEVPIGAVIVYKDEIIARAHNLRETTQNALTHAESMAIAEACKKIGSWR